MMADERRKPGRPRLSRDGTVPICLKLPLRTYRRLDLEVRTERLGSIQELIRLKIERSALDDSE